MSDPFDYKTALIYVMNLLQRNDDHEDTTELHDVFRGETGIKIRDWWHCDDDADDKEMELPVQGKSKPEAGDEHELNSLRNFLKSRTDPARKRIPVLPVKQWQLWLERVENAIAATIHVKIQAGKGFAVDTGRVCITHRELLMFVMDRACALDANREMNILDLFHEDKGELLRQWWGGVQRERIKEQQFELASKQAAGAAIIEKLDQQQIDALEALGLKVRDALYKYKDEDLV